MDPNNFSEEIWAWTLLDTVAELVDREGGVPTQEEVVVWWEKRELDMVADMGEEEERYAMDWLDKDFFRRTDYWKARVGWYEGVNLIRDPLIAWDVPQNQEDATVYRLKHPRFGGWVEGRSKGGANSDTNDLIRIYWVKKLWEAQGMYQDSEYDSMSDGSGY